MNSRKSVSRQAGRASKQALHRRLREALGDEGRHFTRQRAAVFEYLSRVDHHPTAEEVFLAVRQKLPRISLATVYKNLEALAACGTAAKLTYGDAAARYEIRRDHHYHTRCLGCGSLTDLDATAGEQFLKRIRPQAGFEVTDYRLELLGYCRSCRRHHQSTGQKS
ncbi:MAG TPA: transcriptional repressor [Blastocatellia bacterium]|nr:transcriptional repressor [Blastocatellia bacterium]